MAPCFFSVSSRLVCFVQKAPHRVASTFAELVARGQGSRQVLFARELTKLHEELFRGSVCDAAAWLQTKAPRGEFTVVLDGGRAIGGGGGSLSGASAEEQAEAAAAAALDVAVAEVAALVASGRLSVSSAVKQVAKASKDVSKNDLYKRALEATSAAANSPSKSS
jgi:16S rRNA (cytidine1402-2'-O)-methyltransferase